MADGRISQIQLPDGNEYSIRAGAIPYGEVDSTSTATAFTATVPGITELTNGTCILLRNGVVTSASGFTININGLGAKPSYSNMATGNGITPTNPTRETTIFNINYTMLFIYSENIIESGCWICYRGYDANTNTIGYQLRTNSTVKTVSDTARYYKIYFTSADGNQWVPASANSTNSATSAKTVNQRPIDPFGRIVYTSASTSYAAGGNLAATTIWDQYTVTLGYSFNRTGAELVLTTKTPVYVKCAPQTNGSAIIDETTPYVQALPTTADEKIYIFLGIAYDTTHIELIPNHPVYYHDGTGIRCWTGQKIPTKTSDLTNDSGFITGYTDTKVTQAYSTANNSYPILMSATAGISSTSSRGDTTAILNNGLYFNPAAGGLTADVINTNQAYIDLLNCSHLIASDTDEGGYMRAMGTNIQSRFGNDVIGEGYGIGAYCYSTNDNIENGIFLGEYGGGTLYSYDDENTYSYLEVLPNTIEACVDGYTITFPSKDGTIALTSDIPSIPTIPSITLNGSSTTSPSFYAPTGAGTSGQYLKSSGSGAPTWANFPTIPSITLNGSASTSPSFYAPTGAGTSGQYLKSSGSGAPTWTSFPTIPTINLNGSNTTSPTFYAPTSAGTSGYYLKSSGSGAPTWTAFPTNISSFTNDVGYLTSYTETDPTVPAWAKASTKPTYTASEVGAIDGTHLPLEIEDNCLKTIYNIYVSGSSAFLLNGDGNLVTFQVFATKATQGLEAIYAQIINGALTFTQANARAFVIAGLDATSASVKLVSVYDGTIYTVNLQDEGDGLTGTFVSQTLPTSSDITTWNGKQDALVSGTNIKTINNESLLGSGNISISGGTGTKNVWYATCPTAASTSTKVVTTDTQDFTLTTGNMLRVIFTYANSASSPTLKVDSLSTSPAIRIVTGTSGAQYHWQAGETVDFVYNGTYFLMVSRAPATTTYYGPTKLSSSTSSTSTSLAATPSAVKSAYDLANSVNTAITGGGISSSLFVLETHELFASQAIASNAHKYGTPTITKSGTDANKYWPLAIAGWNAPDAIFLLSRLRLTDQAAGSVTVAYDAYNPRSSSGTSKMNVDILWLKTTT